MAPPPQVELARAQTLTSAGDLAGARQILAAVLSGADTTDPRAAHPDLALAAALHARILIALGDASHARAWAAFAHAAEEQLHGPHHERTLAAAAVHAAVLQRVGQHANAARVYHQLVADLSELAGPDAPHVLAAEADLATAEHASGHCAAARARLADVTRRHRRRFGDAEPAGLKMLARLGAMQRECGHHAESQHHLALAQQLCARYLANDHPLVRQVAALATAPPTGSHACTPADQSAGAAEVSGMSATYTPGVWHLRNPHRPAPPAETPPTPVYRQPLYRAAPQRAPADPPGRPDTADLPPTLGSDQPPHGESSLGPAEDDSRLGLAAPVSPGAGGPPADAPTSTGFRGDTPAVGQPAPGTAAARGTVALRPDARPVPSPSPSPEETERRRRSPFLLVGVLAAGVATAVAVVVLTLPDGTTPTATGPATSGGPTASAPGTPTQAASTPPTEKATTAPAVDPGAPRDVRLQDNRDSVALRWAYPTNADGPVLVSGGRTGQQPRAFQQLPSGSAEYVVYGLNAGQNYCFTVSVAYSTDRIATSPQVCTKR